MPRSRYNGAPVATTRGTRATHWLGNLRARRAALHPTRVLLIVGCVTAQEILIQRLLLG